MNYKFIHPVNKTDIELNQVQTYSTRKDISYVPLQPQFFKLRLYLKLSSWKKFSELIYNLISSGYKIHVKKLLCNPLSHNLSIFIFLFWIHMISNAVFVNALHSPWVLDLNTTTCFLALQEMRFGLKIRQNLL